jgi:hypothetical protein
MKSLESARLIICLACRTLEKAQDLAKGIPNATAISVRSILMICTWYILIKAARC